MQQVALTGCTETTGAACSDGAADILQANSSPPALQDHPEAKTEKTATAKKANSRHRRAAKTRIQNARSNIAPETDASSGQRHDKSNTVSAQPPATEVNSESLQSSQLDDNESVIKKAKATIAARMENPASVEFEEMKRSTENDAFGRLLSDVICGYVGQKDASGENIGGRPFLYLVLKDEVYIGDMIGTTDAYKDLATCLAYGRSAS
jgi:hypothetical protein